MSIENAKFIKATSEFISDASPSPLFRRKFTISEIRENVILSVCTLGLGRIFINGVEIEDNLFCSPISDFRKTLWYRKYNISKLLIHGENILAVWCGNGWYNESIESRWGTNTATWRDNPKILISIDSEGETIAESDELFLCNNESAVIFNELRSGEYFDFNLYESGWCNLDYDDSSWSKAIIDTTPPSGVLRECKCEPVRELDIFPSRLIKQENSKYIFDIGQNISGYIRLNIDQPLCGEMVIKYRESIDDDYKLLDNDMERFYLSSPFQCDKVILNGSPCVWSPRFVYHGFRYIEITSPFPLTSKMVSGVYVHQDIKLRSSFNCSNNTFNTLFKMGQMASWSNMFYALTDCPSREKMGWMNDVQASTEQMLTDFHIEKLLIKILQDIKDAMSNDGSLPGIVPTWGWGFDWGNGPVSDGSLFEIPYAIYMHTGDSTHLVDALPYFNRYLEYIRKNSVSGLFKKGLWDWAAPSYGADQAPCKVPVEFINLVLLYKFLRITALAAELAGFSADAYNTEINNTKQLIWDNYIDNNKRCKINEQTAIVLLIYYDICNSENMTNQLKELVESNNFHISTGMVGTRHLFIALNKCGLQEYAYKIFTVDGYPSYKYWIELNATALCEMWEDKHSRNHHMYSDFMSYFIKTILGINAVLPGYKTADISPYFFKELDYARGYQETVSGKIHISWERQNEKIICHINLPDGIKATCHGRKLNSGDNYLEF